MKTMVKVIGTDTEIMARNKRELNMIRHFLIKFEVASDIYADDGDSEALWSRCKRLGGMTDSMHWLGMLDLHRESLYAWNLVTACRKNAESGAQPFLERVEREV